MRPGLIEQSVPCALDNIERGDLPEPLVVLDQRTGLVALEARHHDVHEHDIRLNGRDLGSESKPRLAVNTSQPSLVKEGFGGPPDGLAGVDHRVL